MPRARELRFAFTLDDYDAALQLVRDVSGLETLMNLDQPVRGILKVPSAALELFDNGQGRLVDDFEVGHSVGGRARIAVKVDDLEEARTAIPAGAASPMADPVDTP